MKISKEVFEKVGGVEIHLSRDFTRSQDGEYVLKKPEDMSVKKAMSYFLPDTIWKKMDVGEIKIERLLLKGAVRRVEIKSLPTRGKYAEQCIKITRIVNS